MGRRTEARASYLEALGIDADLAGAYRGIGRIARDDRWPDEALAWFRIALDLDTGSVEIRCDLSGVLEDLGRCAEAVALSEEALALDPGSAKALISLGSARLRQGRVEDSTRHFLRAIDENPESTPAHFGLAVTRNQMGQRVAAEASFRDVLRLRPDHSSALVELATLLRDGLPEADLAEIRRLIADPEFPETRRGDLHFGAAQVYDARGEYPKAAGHLRLGNAIKRAEMARAGREYRPDEHDQLVDEIIDACTPGFFERVQGFGLATERPVFIFGLPRSGTTLTEQILASHSRVRGAGELRLGRSSFESLVPEVDPTSSYAACLGKIDRESAGRIARSHLAGLDEIDREATFVVDKLPDNHLFLGLLAILFPRAKFIHCRRDPCDVAVSCWLTNFREFRWTSDVDHIASRFAAYQRLSDHWSRTLPVPVLEVHYEETVSDLESAARRLIDWCRLPWEPACLSFQHSRNLVRTASATQVRQPIYTRSVERWRNYEFELGPLFDRLRRSAS